MIWTDALKVGDFGIDSCHREMFACLEKIYNGIIEKEHKLSETLMRSFSDLTAIHAGLEHNLFGCSHSPSHELLDDRLSRIDPQEFIGRRTPFLLETVHNIQRALLTDVFHDKMAMNPRSMRKAAPKSSGPGGAPIWQFPCNGGDPHSHLTG
jgi:hypothetical protein